LLKAASPIRNRPLLTLYLAALALRLIPVLLTIDLPIGLDDMFQYDMLARNLSAGHGFRWYGADDLALIARFIDLDVLLPADYDPRGVLTNFRAPLYPLFLAGVYLLADETRRFFAARLVQAFIGAALAPLAMLLAKRLFPGTKDAHALAGWVIALYPTLWVYPLALATENLFIPLTLVALLVLLHAIESERMRDLALAGFLFGLAALTRSVILAAMPFVALWFWLQPGTWRARLKSIAILAFATALTIAPWVARNSLLHGGLSSIESSMGYNLHMGYHPDADGTFTFGPSLELLPIIDDEQRDQRGRELAWDYIQADPARVPELMLRKLGHFFGLEIRPLVYFYSNGLLGALPPASLGGVLLLFGLPWVLLASLAVPGALLTSPTSKQSLTLFLALGYLLPHVFIMAESRFHLALLPIVAAFAARAWAERGQIPALAGQRRWFALALLACLWLNIALALYADAPRLAILFGPDGHHSYFDY
jgi:4-amino-4-deoxy-L-arabinose transferase-like glycosyltransferase